MSLYQTEQKPVLISGNGRLSNSISVCFLQSGLPVVLHTDNVSVAEKEIEKHITASCHAGNKLPYQLPLKITNRLQPGADCRLAIVISEEDAVKKKVLIEELEKKISNETIIAVNTESIPLRKIQEDALHPKRIIGLNWSEPAHTTYFLEIIINSACDERIAGQLTEEAKLFWGKDPYIVKGELGIRAKMMAAMVREAFYLVDNGYASIDDIDRACRNDPGYYLPFAGNLRYIDLMGGPALYGRVMKDLNPDLSKSHDIPRFFLDAVKKGNGLSDERGLYEYQKGEKQKWEKTFEAFSYEVKQLMDKYPFEKVKEQATEYDETVYLKENKSNL